MKRFNALNILSVLICLCTSSLLAQEQKQDSLSVSSKVDSIYTMQKKMYAIQKKMYDETKNEPLLNKKFGIEFNFFRLLWLEKSVNLSGGFSLFNINRKAEIAFPIFYSNPEDPEDLQQLTIDCHFRYFLGNTQNGFYLSAFARYAHLAGYLGNNDLDLFEDDVLDTKSTENKFGMGFGIGYRKFSYSGFYWGTSLGFGRYIVGENNKFHGGFLAYDDDNEFILIFELLKFGFAF